jgi:signal transduction histidine kinase
MKAGDYAVNFFIKHHVWVNTALRLVSTADNDSYEIHGLSVDITLTKEAQLALCLSEKRSRLLAETSYLLSQSLNLDKMKKDLEVIIVPEIADRFLITLSDEQHKVFSIDEDPKLGIHIAEVLSTGTSLYSPERLIIPMETRAKIWGCMVFIRHTRLTFQGFSLHDKSTLEEFARRVSMLMDNAQLFHQSQLAIRARDEFLSIASHELKTPLTPLKLQTQMMMKTFTEADSIEKIPIDKVLRMVQSSNRQITRLSQLIEDLLDVSRINIGKLGLNLEDFDLADLLNDVMEHFSHQTKDMCKIEIQSCEKVQGSWDRFRLEQVFVNLLTNAFKYGSGKPVKIKLESTPNQARFIIQDHGIGIAKEDQQRIFERFERAVSSAHFGGLGLGLFISSEIVRAHGGELKVESEVGKGSTFIVELPRFNTCPLTPGWDRKINQIHWSREQSIKFLRNIR